MSRDFIKNYSFIEEPANEYVDNVKRKIFGFWIYLLSDCILFATLFVTYAVLSKNYAGGPTPREIIDLKAILIETLCLLTSSFTFGLCINAIKKSRNLVLFWMILTLIFGASFIFSEAREFHRLISHGHGPNVSAYLSAFFTLVGTHGLHVSLGLLWMLVMTVTVIRKDLTKYTAHRLLLLSWYWHFLDIIWICIFSLVYLIGVS